MTALCISRNRQTLFTNVPSEQLLYAMAYYESNMFGEPDLFQISMLEVFQILGVGSVSSEFPGVVNISRPKSGLFPKQLS